MANKESRIKLYLAEEQEILRTAYQAFLVSHPRIILVGTSEDTSSDSVVGAARALQPHVILLGVKVLQACHVETLERLRQSGVDPAVVLMFSFYDAGGIKALKELARASHLGKGCSYLLKHTIDTSEQLAQVINSVVEGRIIVDPPIMDKLLSGSEASSTFLKELSPRELEVLKWLAKGYKNNTIAEVLSLEPKTIERHINNIYSKLGNGAEAEHARVRAATLYLKAIGQLSGDEIAIN